MFETTQVLEYEKIAERVAACAVSQPTAEYIRRFTPCSDKAQIERLLTLTDEADRLKNYYNINPLCGFDSTIELCEKSLKGGILTMGELLKVGRLLRASRIAKKNIEGSPDDVVLLKEITFSYYLNEPLEKNISDSILSDTEMRDDASEKLRSIRRKIATEKSRLKEKISSYFRSGEYSKYLQDNLVTIRNGRFVLPVKSESRSFVPGLIHDSSASGATVFIEPFPIVEMNNELRALQIEEQSEIERILAELTEGVATYSAVMQAAELALINIEAAFARMEYSISIRGVRPSLNEKGVVNLIDSRHPLLDENRVVSNTVTVGRDYRILAITGPNTGGKTVALKTVGLLSLMAYAGIRIPCAEGSQLAIFDDVFCDIGDEQSIELSLSTFSSHIYNISDICNKITPKSLVLFDELGAGTDPKEGAALAVGILKYLELMGCVAIVTTHYPEVKEYALTSTKASNACMQFDEERLAPTYKLLLGVPGASNALKIAQNLGINSYITDVANSLITSEITFENAVAQAERLKSEVEKELAVVKAEKERAIEIKNDLLKQKEELDKKYAQVSAGVKSEIRRIVSQRMDEAEELIEEIKDKLKSADDKALFEARAIKKRIEGLDVAEDEPLRPIRPITDADMVVNARVYIKSINGEGELIQAKPNKKGEYAVRVGALNLNVKKADLAVPLIKEKSNTGRTLTQKRASMQQATEYSEVEIKVLGQTVADAITVIEPYIMSMAAENGGKIIKIIHGKGTGALGRGIQEYLRSNPLVQSYRYGRYGEGESGVTFAEIK